jgi:hypothetical protein
MNDSLKLDKKIRLTIMSLPETIFVKYSRLELLFIFLANGLSMFFASLFFIAITVKGWNRVNQELVSLSILICFVFLTIIMDIDVVHSLMKKQFIEITHKYIRVKKLVNDKKINWSDIESIQELHNRHRILTGVKITSSKCKKILLSKDIAISFDKYANIDIENFFEILHIKRIGKPKVRI